MKRTKQALFLGLIAATALACGPQDGGLGSSSQDLELSRRAIFAGLDLGHPAMVSSINDMLQQNTLSYDVQGDFAVPDANVTMTCPFLVQSPTATRSCRSLIEEATPVAFSRVAYTLDHTNLADVDPEFASAQNPDDVRAWFEAASFFALDNEAVHALAELRTLGACDQDPQPVLSGEIQGTEQGRAIFRRHLEARMAVAPRTECNFDVAVIDPARTTATAEVPSFVAANTLCDGFSPGTAEQSLELSRARLSFQEGVRLGILDEATLASRQLLDQWVCVAAQPQGDPLVLDLAGDGFAPATQMVAFDLTGSSVTSQVAWPAASDALLALDVNGNGIVDNGRELFGDYMQSVTGSGYATGFAALAAYDHEALGGNGDGKISAHDEVFGKLLVWQDKNHDGQSQTNEITTLASAGFDELALDAVSTGRLARGKATVTEQAGSLAEMWLGLEF